MAWQHWVSVSGLACSVITAGRLLLVPVTMDNIASIHLWGLAALAGAVLAGAGQLHLHHRRLRALERR
jgi:hypothetical protein